VGVGSILPGIAEATSAGHHYNLPDVINIAEHVGSLWPGGVVATLGSYAFLAYNYQQIRKETGVEPKQDRVSAERLSAFRKYGTPAIMAATALVNCITETKWGVEHLPVAGWFNGKTPDVLDTAYSTVWAGICANLFWIRTRARR